MTVWVHLHIPRLRSGEPDMLSVKVPGQQIDYASWISLENVEFKVHEAGRRRCITQGVRNVHAWVVGDEILRIKHGDWVGDLGVSVRADRFRAPVGFRQAVYDPWKGGTFVDSATLTPVLHAPLAILSGKNVYYTHSGG